MSTVNKIQPSIAVNWQFSLSFQSLPSLEIVKKGESVSYCLPTKESQKVFYNFFKL